MNLLMKHLHKSNMRRKAEGEKDVALEKLGWGWGGSFSLLSKLWHQLAQCWVRNPSVAFLQTVGQLQQHSPSSSECNLKQSISQLCPGETMCLSDASRSLNPAVKTLFAAWWRSYLKYDGHFIHLQVKALNYWLPLSEIIRECPCHFILRRNGLTDLWSAHIFYLRQLQFDSTTISGFGSLRVSGNEWCMQIIFCARVTNHHLNHPYQVKNCCLTDGWNRLYCITSSLWNVSLSIYMSHLPRIFLTSDIMSVCRHKKPQTWFE